MSRFAVSIVFNVLALILVLMMFFAKREQDTTGVAPVLGPMQIQQGVAFSCFDGLTIVYVDGMPMYKLGANGKPVACK